MHGQQNIKICNLVITLMSYILYIMFIIICLHQPEMVHSTLV